VFLKQARDKGIKSQFMGPDGWDSPDLAKLGGDAAVGAIYTSTAGPVSVYPAAKQLLADYKKIYGIDATPYVPESYAATQIVLHAIETVLKANGGKMPTRKEVSEAVRATKDFDTVAGKITFDAHGDPVYAAYYVLKATSADPAKWSENPVLQTTTAPSPLTAQAMASATMAATSTK
jgi:branched-chain amino acid transport system substrate-binding protein